MTNKMFVIYLTLSILMVLKLQQNKYFLEEFAFDTLYVSAWVIYFSMQALVQSLRV